ncbi:CYTH domain-containing protein [Colwellia sp. E2M01]|uniref:CYTH domain-containing protein n=1 Tax=Colwellia sp. E2M01 TaxID=2841561 RepID=UPI001C09C374|nr:CYTH domain-containing protein [Colwellia sp. E2M01]MBU2869684.1 CYTH domain-containing protein [Colwellia sp. E2M01]
MVTEIELKYSLLENPKLTTSEQINTVISQLFTEQQLTFVQQEKHLSNYYFDTPEFTLRKQRIALRTRGTKSAGENERFEQTIKKSGTVVAGLHQRPEYNVDIDNAKPVLALFPTEVWQTDTDVNQLQQQVIELFSTNFTRNTWLVTMPSTPGDNQGDTQIEVAFDCGEIACSGYGEKPRIFEIELELVSGTRDSLFTLTEILFSQLALRPGQLTKAARGYALYRESIATNNDNQVDNITEVNQPVTVSAINTSFNSSFNPIINSSVDLAKGVSPSLRDAFIHGLSTRLTQLQLNVDAYVSSCNADTDIINKAQMLSSSQLIELQKIKSQLLLMRHGFYLFDEITFEDEKVIAAELSYFIDTLVWVEPQLYNRVFSQNLLEQLPQSLSSTIEFEQVDEPVCLSNSAALTVLHSERFNQLQLKLLILFLKDSENQHDVKQKQAPYTLNNFAAKQLTHNIERVNNELINLSKIEPSLFLNNYQNIEVLLNKALSTISWFSSVFTDNENDIIETFNSPLLDIRSNLKELQCLTELQLKFANTQQEPLEEKQLSALIENKCTHLCIEIKQSSVQALAMQPYW